MLQDIIFRANPTVSNEDLNALFAASWEHHNTFWDFTPIHERSLVFICAYQGERLIGYVNLAWDGGVHAFLLDPTVHPDARRRGIGVELVRRAVDVARGRGLEWVHVDFEPHLREFYAQCGFRPTEAGLIDLQADDEP